MDILTFDDLLVGDDDADVSDVEEEHDVSENSTDAIAEHSDEVADDDKQLSPGADEAGDAGDAAGSVDEDNSVKDSEDKDEALSWDAKAFMRKEREIADLQKQLEEAKKASGTSDDDELAKLLKSLGDDDDDDDDEDSKPVTKAELKAFKQSLKAQEEWIEERRQERIVESMNKEIDNIVAEFPEMPREVVLLSFVKGVDPRDVAAKIRGSFESHGYRKGVDNNSEKEDQQDEAPAPLSAPPSTTPTGKRKAEKKKPKKIETWDDLLDL